MCSRRSPRLLKKKKDMNRVPGKLSARSNKSSYKRVPPVGQVAGEEVQRETIHTSVEQVVVSRLQHSAEAILNASMVSREGRMALQHEAAEAGEEEEEPHEAVWADKTNHLTERQTNEVRVKMVEDEALVIKARSLTVQQAGELRSGPPVPLLVSRAVRTVPSLWRVNV